MSAASPAWVQVFLDVPGQAFEDSVAFWSAVTGWQPSERRGEDGQFLTLLPAAGSAAATTPTAEGSSTQHSLQTTTGLK